MNRTKSVVPIKIELTDIITPKSCSFFIAELIKYVAYNKQQIPYPYERLKMFVLKRRERQKLNEMSQVNTNSHACIRAAFIMEKYFKKVEEAFEILDSTFKCIEHELLKSNENHIEEVILLFGATPISPKDVYRIQIPSLSYGHSDAQHLWKRQIGNLFREIIVSEEFNANIQCRVGLTNMFVILKAKKGYFINSQWLLPKDQYRLSERAQQVCFSFESSSTKACTCSPQVNQFDVLAQSMAALRMTDENLPSCENNFSNSCSESDDQFLWFQTSRSLKGFRDCKSEGKSVTDLWYKYSFIS